MSFRASLTTALSSATRFLGWVVVLWLVTTSSAWAQTAEPLCRAEAIHGFSGTSRTGVAVRVGADKVQGFATHSCAAELRFDKKTITVAERAAEVDLDMLDASLDESGPVAAFQIKQSDTSCCVTYRVYGLKRGPQLVSELSGGSHFVAKDVPLDGKIELWTDDAAAVNGFDGISLSQLDFVPTYVLRFYDGRWYNVSSEFVGFYDEEIAKLQAQIKPDALGEFLRSDGVLRVESISTVAELSGLSSMRRTKIAVLEIVWAYLYSGRSQDAWRVLDEMWPASDRERVRNAILEVQQHGMAKQFSSQAPPLETQIKEKKSKVLIYQLKDDHNRVAQPIFIRFSEPFRGSYSLQFVVDKAGKVHSVAGDGVEPPAEVLAAAARWKFIPAWHSGMSVASKVNLTVSLAK